MIEYDNTSIQVLEEFKLLGVTIDNKLHFKTHVDQVASAINRKLYAIKRVFYLSRDVKIQFFKSFILPYFDYCITLSIYYNTLAISKLHRTYYKCLNKLFGFNFEGKSCFEINNELSEFKLFSFQHRLVLRMTAFTHATMYAKTSPIQLKTWLEPTTLENTRYELRSNNKVVFLADRSCLKFGDITFKHVFCKYLNELKDLIFTPNFRQFNQKLNESIDYCLNKFLKILPKFNCLAYLTFNFKLV